MLQRLTPRQRFEILVSQYEPQLRQAFIEAIDDIRSNILLRRIVERLERNDINGAIRAMNLDEAAFRPLDEAMRQAFNGGGVAAVEGMPALRDPSGFQVFVRWDARNLAAENWLREHSTTLVTNIVADQQTAIRTALEEGPSQGDNPTRTALSVVGRVNRVTGSREGGIIGLTSAQSQYVDNPRWLADPKNEPPGAQLESGDPKLLKNYLTRVRRDRRFDRTILKAIKDGKPLDAVTVNRIVGLYSEGLLKLRGDTIALHETFNSLAAAKDIAFRQQIEKGTLQAQHVTKTWKHTPGQEHPRLQHIAVQRHKVQFDQPFVAPDGTAIPYPHAPGIPVRHSVFCHCPAEYKIDFVAQLVR